MEFKLSQEDQVFDTFDSSSNTSAATVIKEPVIQKTPLDTYTKYLVWLAMLATIAMLVWANLLKADDIQKYTLVAPVVSSVTLLIMLIDSALVSHYEHRKFSLVPLAFFL